MENTTNQNTEQKSKIKTEHYQTRAEVPEQYRWNLEKIYANPESWSADFDKIEPAAAKLVPYRGRLAESVTVLKEAFDALAELDLLIERLYVFAHHRSDEDTGNSTNMGQVDRIRSKAIEVGARLSWMDPELLSASQEKLEKYQRDPSMKDYARKLEFLIRSKPHQRSAEVEEILALASEPMSGSYKTFSLLENADMKIPSARDSAGKVHEMNHSSYGSYLESDDRTLRKNAYQEYMTAFSQYKNTFASTLDSHVKKQVFYAKVRNFKSAREASLFSDQIPVGVYDGLIDTVHAHLPLLHRWTDLKKKTMGVESFEAYDLLLPMVKPANVEIAYDQAQTMVLQGAQFLGQEYTAVLKTALNNRWIDVYYTQGKRSGAYSGGMYESDPYILLNHRNNLNSAFTLAHELGHSLHTYFANQNNSYYQSQYPIFLAEVASTTNEMLMHFHLYDQAQSKEMKLYLLDHLFTQFRATLYRQVQFAEFERDVHAFVEQGQPLTADSLSDHYEQLNAIYYGPSLEKHELMRYEWSRIPHFYYNFYVYKYSTSFAAAQYFARKIYDGDQDCQKKYLSFLKSGGSKDPLDTLKDAGLDLTDAKPIEAAFSVFKDALDEFEALI